jgi:hypothetical protein
MDPREPEPSCGPHAREKRLTEWTWTQCLEEVMTEHPNAIAVLRSFDAWNSGDAGCHQGVLY